VAFLGFLAGGLRTLLAGWPNHGLTPTWDATYLAESAKPLSEIIRTPRPVISSSAFCQGAGSELARTFTPSYSLGAWPVEGT